MFGFSRRRESVSTPSPEVPRELVLYKFDSCFYCRRVFKALDAMGDIGVELRDIRRDPEARKELLEKTGSGQVPCLVIDGAPLFESLDIIDWLEAYAVAGAGSR